ncbi:MAG: Ig-like domain-containing protein [Cyclobacteriaceae bacterium]
MNATNTPAGGQHLCSFLINYLSFRFLLGTFLLLLCTGPILAQAPQLEIISEESSPTQADTIPLVFSFDDHVNGFDADDISVENGTLLGFTPESFSYAATLGEGRGDSGARMDFPINVETDQEGRIYVADRNNHRIQVFDSNYELEYVLGSGPGSDNASFNEPMDVSIDHEGNIYVADRENHRIQIFSSEFEYLATLGNGVAGYDSAQFRQPSGVLLGDDGKIYVADTENHRIQVFDQDYELLSIFGFTDPGDINDRFRSPMDMAMDERGWLYVADFYNNRVRIFDTLYQHQANLGSGEIGTANDEFYYVSGIDIDDQGRVYVADHSNHRIQVYDTTRQYLYTIGEAEVGSGENNFNNLYGLAVDDDYNIYAADRDNHRVQVFEYQPYTAVVVPEERGEVRVSVPEGAAVSSAQQGNAAADFSILVNPRPRLAMSTDASGTVEGSFEVQMVFNDTLGGFGTDDLSLSNGTLLSLETEDSLTYTASIEPINDGIVSISIDENLVRSGSQITLAVTYQPPLPTLQLLSTAADTVEGSFVLQLVFSDTVSGFSLDDISIDNGTVSGLQTDDSLAYSIEVQPDSTGQVNVSVDSSLVSSEENSFSVVYVNPITSVSETLEASSLQYYPNPARSGLQLKMKLQKRQDVEIVLSDLAGNQLFSRVLKQQQQVEKYISLQDYPAGAYLLSLYIGEQSLSRRILVE